MKSRTRRSSQARRSRPDARPRVSALAGPSLATKGDEVEEWIDLRFFRPIGVRIARRLARTRVTADQVTLLSLVIGLAAGHLFVYTSPWLNAIGFVLFIISDIFDSADGQLARLRGTSTRFGRALDGTSDAARFINLGIHLLVRLVIAQQWNWLAATSLVVVAAIGHSVQSATIDFIRHAFLALAVGRGSELDFDGTEDLRNTSWVRRMAVEFYRTYSRRQLGMFPRTTILLRAARDHQLGSAAVAAYRSETLVLVRQCAWLGQNFRFLVLGVTAIAGWPAGLLWITALPMNAVLVWLRWAQERSAERVQRAFPSVSRPAPPAAPALAIGGE